MPPENSTAPSSSQLAPATQAAPTTNPPSKNARADDSEDRPVKRVKMDDAEVKKYEEVSAKVAKVADYRDPMRGVARVKQEYLKPKSDQTPPSRQYDDDAAESKTYVTSGVKESYGTPRRATAKGQQDGQQAPSTKENDRPQPASSDPATAQLSDQAPDANGEGGQPQPKPKKEWQKNKKGWEKNKKKESGQNKNRQYGKWGDEIKLCSSLQFSNEFSPADCKHGDKCKFSHDLRKYLDQGKKDDLKTEEFEVCPIYEDHGFCPVGWQCRFVGSHSKEVERDGGKKELVLVKNEERMKELGFDEENTKGLGAKVFNVIDQKDRIELERRRVDFSRSDEYAKWLVNAWGGLQSKQTNTKKDAPIPNGDKEEAFDVDMKDEGQAQANGEAPDAEMKDDVNGEEKAVKSEHDENKADARAGYKEAPYRPSEKRRLYYGPETPVLAPLTTQGNLPFRRLCVDLGAQVTWSEMAMGMPLIQGQKGEWALVKTHESERAPPKVNPGSNIIEGYDNSRDMKFGVQVAANKPWVAFKATEVLAKYTPNIRAIDFNCGCPIDMVFNTGGGSALLDQAPKLEKILRGMNALSDEIPIQVKVRMGVKDNQPTAAKLAERLILGGHSAQQDGLGPCGIAAMTLHGRSRQQRYTKLANWKYIASVSAMIKDLHAQQAAAADTIHEVDLRDHPNGGKVYFIGNGDVFSPGEYNEHITQTGVDSIMIGRGALIKPWVFEEIEQGRDIDKSSTERFEYIKKFCRYGLDTWGSDEMGVGTTRRFLLEWLSFAHRYIPLGLLEQEKPAKINERPPPYVCRDDKETLLASDNYKDWIEISNMFLGKPHKDFKFVPKHKSNSYEETEG